MFLLGIGLNFLAEKHTKRAEGDLKIIASSSENVFNVTNFDKLEEKVKNMVLSFCSKSCADFEQKLLYLFWF